MNRRFTSNISVTGLGHIILGITDETADPTPYLKVKKNRKFMAMQDCLATIAAGRAIENSTLPLTPSPQVRGKEEESSQRDDTLLLPPPLGGRAGVGVLPEKIGLFVAVGYLPFEEDEINLLVENSQVDGKFDINKFASDGLASVNPLLTFRCLPNMPLFHISANFDIRGTYFATYGGAFQFYIALKEAIYAINEGKIDTALVGGVAHQNNFLVKHHFSKMGIDTDNLKDAAGFMVLEKGNKGASFFIDKLEYNSFNPLENFAQEEEHFSTDCISGMGVASLPAMLSHNKGSLEHSLKYGDEVGVISRWDF